MIEDIEEIDRCDKTINYNIPASIQNPIALSSLFTEIEVNKHENGINFWGISQTR